MAGGCGQSGGGEKEGNGAEGKRRIGMGAFNLSRTYCVLVSLWTLAHAILFYQCSFTLQYTFLSSSGVPIAIVCVGARALNKKDRCVSSGGR